MKPAAFSILIDADATHVTRADANGTHLETLLATEAAPNQPVEWGASIRAKLDGIGYRGQMVTLGLPSAWLLAASITTHDLPRRERRLAMVYRLEESLPIPAEDYAAAFTEHQGQALGVAVRTAVARPIIVALEDAGIPVGVVTTTVMLAAQEACVDQGASSGLIAVETDGRLDRVTLRAGVPDSWQSVHPDSPRAESIRRLNVIQSPYSTADPVNASLVAAPLDAATRMARRLSAGATAWFDLRTGALAAADPLRHVRRPIRFAIAAAVVALVAVTGALLVQTHRVQTHRDDLLAQQQTIFRETLPGRRVPVTPKLVLESEAKRLAATAGEDAGLPSTGHAVASLYEVLRRLPTDLRYRVLEVRIDDHRLQVQGEARSHGDADLIAAALRRQRGFDVQPVRTERLRDRGVAFTINADGRMEPTLARQEDDQEGLP